MRRHSSQRLALTVIMAALLAVSGYELGRARAASDPDQAAPTPPPVAARGPRDSFAPAVASAAPAVVHVKVTSMARSHTSSRGRASTSITVHAPEGMRGGAGAGSGDSAPPGGCVPTR